MTIKRIGFVSVTVSDQQRALAFWRDIVGFEVAVDAPMSQDDPQGARWIEMRIPGAETGLVLMLPMGPEDKPGRFLNMAFTAEDLDSTYQTLLDKGARFKGPPESQFWGRFVLLLDPDDNVLCIAEPGRG